MTTSFMVSKASVQVFDQGVKGRKWPTGQDSRLNWGRPHTVGRLGGEADEVRAYVRNQILCIR